ncbi:DUF4870 domain-containing protein [Allosalinactinospora lopnorensis]|uniref:DUF4870 domain-containing protein n=1 Tax=Allosalinactinospora lopnorensis TaxID=1352348 RepID=UPI000623EA39|nr:DUF4870 domain-containing protein [Allosalinactinospora lopnorensis]
MSTPYPPNDGQSGQSHYPGGYGPPPGGNPGYGSPSGPYPGYGGQYPGQYPGQGGQMPQPPYQGQYYQQPYTQGPGGPVSSDDRTMGLIIHLGGFLLGFLLPLVLYLVKKDESPWVRYHAAQAFNFQMTMLIGIIVSSILMVVIIGILLLPVVLIADLVFAILAAVAANRGEWYRYPVAIPMLT